MSELKSKLHELIDGTNDNILLENIYNALRQQVENKPKDFLDELSADQLNELHEANAQYESGETKTHEEVLELLSRWRKK
jgi:hypothetical protein